MIDPAKIPAGKVRTINDARLDWQQISREVTFIISRKPQPPYVKKGQAEGIREVAKELGIQCEPVMLKALAGCPVCGRLVLMLVEPHRMCWDCFGKVN